MLTTSWTQRPAEQAHHMPSFPSDTGRSYGVDVYDVPPLSAVRYDSSDLILFSADSATSPALLNFWHQSGASDGQAMYDS
jgi:hypothetical protein